MSDDITIALDIEDPPPLTARDHAVAERRKAQGKKSFARRLANRFFRRKGVKAARARTTRNLARAASRARGAAGVARGAAGASRAAAVLNPVTLVIAALAAIGIAGGRIISGKTFEQMGEEFEALILGDNSTKTKAKLLARQQLAGDPNLLEFIGQQDTTQAKMLFNDLVELKEREVMADKLFRKEFGVNGMLDIIIIRLWDALIAGWKGAGGPDAVDRLSKAYQKNFLATPKQGAR